MNAIFKRIQPIGAKGKFPRLCLSSCTGALHANDATRQHLLG